MISSPDGVFTFTMVELLDVKVTDARSRDKSAEHLVADLDSADGSQPQRPKSSSSEGMSAVSIR